MDIYFHQLKNSSSCLCFKKKKKNFSCLCQFGLIEPQAASPFVRPGLWQQKLAASPVIFLPMARPVWAACHHSTYFFCTTRIISTALATDFLFHSQHFSEPPAVCFTIIFDILSEEDLKRKLDGAL